MASTVGNVHGGRRYGGNIISAPSSVSRTRAMGSIVRRSGHQNSFVNQGPPTGFTQPSGTTSSRYPVRQLSGYIVTRQEAVGNAGR